MQFSADREVLNNALNIVSPACPAKPSHPVLAGIVFAADRGSGRVTLRAFDLSIGLQTSFPAEIKESGEIVVSGKLVRDIIAKLPDGAVNFVLSNTTVPVEPTEENGGMMAKTGYLLKVSVKRSSYKLSATAAEQFPAFEFIEDPELFTLPTALLNPGPVLFAVSKDATKQILTGVHLSVNADRFEFAATDGHRLSVAEYPAPELEDTDECPEPFAATIPGRAFDLYRKLATGLKDDSNAVETQLTVGRGVAQFELGDTILITRTIEGQYPAYNQLIPRQFDRMLTVKRKPLLEALLRISEIANERANKIVKFEITDGELEVLAECADVGTGAEGIDDIQYAGGDFIICFNIKYLEDSLKNLTAEEVQFQMNTPTSPVILIPLGGDKIKHLVMPVQVRS